VSKFRNPFPSNSVDSEKRWLNRSLRAHIVQSIICEDCLEILVHFLRKVVFASDSVTELVGLVEKQILFDRILHLAAQEFVWFPFSSRHAVGQLM
jgi:hypothetical protein